eukprot:gene14268-biopygen1027
MAYIQGKNAAPLLERINRVLTTVVFSAGILALDFYFTRGFATGMRDREAALRSSVAAAEEVGELLAGYDTDAAKKLLADAGVCAARGSGAGG